MKIVWFQGGQPGVEHVLPGDKPLEELAELLEGEVELIPLDGRLKLAVRTDGEELRLPIHYGVQRLGRALEPIAGDCAVAAVDRGGRIRDIRTKDLQRVKAYILGSSAERQGAGGGMGSSRPTGGRA